ncbi:hypothetical protein BXT90_08715 [Corynebacterium amycolatum]|uniref:hypothetical protein n=2 Tax=Corynebacterium amycolatum TaxID=43765 RepID=UPI000975AC55|nr:hypothetical protein [Corynebacterium amycolatum]OMQ06278.1 hypothetical protein BXT90_08715 [Corynebacterium amycolatum]
MKWPEGMEMVGMAGDADVKAVKTANVRDGAALALGLVIVVIGSTMPSGLYAIYQRDWGAEHR